MLSPQFAWARRPSAKRAAVVAVVGIAALAALAGALAANHGTLARVEAATLSISGVDAQGVQTTGTGMTLTPAGIVLTADRIVENADTISVRIPGGTGDIAASIVGLDPIDDLAVIQLQGTFTVPAAPVNGAAAVSVGEHVAAISARGGMPVEVQGSVVGLRHVGSVHPGGQPSATSGIDVLILSSTMSGLESGQPVVDASGDVVAISVASMTGPDAAPSGTIALQIGDALAIAQDVLSGAPNANVLHGASSVLGVAVQDSVAPQGARVTVVAAASPARAADIVAGDVIDEIGAIRVTSAAGLPDALRRFHAGDAVRVRWVTVAGGTRTATILIAGGTAR